MSKEISIIGGGFSGLTAAYYLSQAGLKVHLFEPAKLGGQIQTKILPEMQVETAANAFLLTAELKEIGQKIGCEFLHVQKQGQSKYIYRGGYKRWPIGLLSTLRLVIFIIFRRSGPRPHESVQEWGTRVLNQEIVDYLIAPALQGIYAGDVQQLSASLILKRFLKRGKKSRSEGSVAPSLGMSDFIHKLVAYLKSQNVQFHSKKIESLEEIQGPKLIAVSLPELLRLEPKLQTHELTVLNLARVTLGLKPGSQTVKGFGVLFPQKENFNSLGVLANSQIFSNRGTLYNESWILGGALNSHILDQSDDVILSEIQEDRARLVGQRDVIQTFDVVRCKSAYVHYDLHLENWIHHNHTFFSNPKKEMWVGGNFLGAIGLSQILATNKEMAQKIAEVLCKK
jgi:protoporphyrinogen/coproporphyrinogen III oxidase